MVSAEQKAKLRSEILTRISKFALASNARFAYSVDRPPGQIENRVFIGGSYVLMPILREIETVVCEVGLQPILACDFDIPRDKTRDYTLRLLYQCRYAIFEETLAGGHFAEIARAGGFQHMNVLQVFMAANEKKEPPNTMSVMIWQTDPPPQGYLTIKELREIIQTFLSRV
jgi:hypothetical protein